MKFILVVVFCSAVALALPSEYLIEAQIAALKNEKKCDEINRWNFQEEGKIWHDSCPHCRVCGAEEMGGKLLEAQEWCIKQTGGADICRSGCGCPEGYFRHNVTRQRGNIEVVVEICITTSECSQKISDIKCPAGQMWDPQAPFCTRECENTHGPLHQKLFCPKFWTPRCICPPEKPIWHNEECIRLSECPK